MTTQPPEPKPEEKPPEPKPEEKPPEPKPEEKPPEPKPVEDMTPEEQIAYWKARSRDNEKWKGKEIQEVLGDLTPAQVKDKLEEADKLARERMTEHERALADARKEAREKAIAEATPTLVQTAFELALGEMPEDERTELIDTLDLSKFVDDNGRVDTAKVKATAARLAGPEKGSGTRRTDYGGGRREGTKSSGVGTGRELFEAEQAKRQPAQT